jgi:HPt (histidine-containing phosphotransfer) domain-containing protein
MTGLEIIKSLEAASVKQAERITKLTQLRARLESKLDKQRNELARLHQEVARLKREKKDLVVELRASKERA